MPEVRAPEKADLLTWALSRSAFDAWNKLPRPAVLIQLRINSAKALLGRRLPTVIWFQLCKTG